MHFRLQSPDTLDLLAERDMKRYRLQRRLIGPIYHTNNVRRYEHAVDAVLERVVEQLRSLNGSEVELKEWMHIITVECLAAVSISWSPGYLKERSDGASGKHAYMGWRRKSVMGLFSVAAIMETYSRSEPSRVRLKSTNLQGLIDRWGEHSQSYGVSGTIRQRRASDRFSLSVASLSLSSSKGLSGLANNASRPCRRRYRSGSRRLCGRNHRKMTART